MGLDMYLSAQKYIEKIDWNKAEKADLASAIRPEWQNVINAAGVSAIEDGDVYGCAVKVNAAYWRKANQIHQWFVDNVQEVLMTAVTTRCPRSNSKNCLTLSIKF